MTALFALLGILATSVAIFAIADRWTIDTSAFSPSALDRSGSVEGLSVSQRAASAHRRSGHFHITTSGT